MTFPKDVFRPKRIGIDARMYSSHFTGIGRYVHELTSRLFQIAPEHEYVLFMNEPQYSQFVEPHKFVKKVLVNAAHYSLAEQTRFWKALHRERLDLMHFTHFNAPLFYRGKSVVTIHDLTLSFFPGKKMKKWYHRLAYNAVIRTSVGHAKRVIAVSKNTQKDLMQLLKTPASKIRVIYEGVGQEFREIRDESLLNAARLRHSISKDFILYTGVWRSHKNVINLIKAFHHLLKESRFQGFEGQLVITGREDPFYPELKEMIHQLNLQNHVVLTGLVSEEDLVLLYNAARVYCLPSLYEGFGLPPLEAMACGTPVAVSKTSCLPEICGEENALFFNPHDSQNIAQVLWEAWSNEALRHRLRSNGLHHVKTFSWDKMAEETLTLYNEIL